MATTTVEPGGGIEIGGSAPVTFAHGTNQVAADVVVEWDFDNDGDFSESVENITSYVVSLETLTGRDWPSQLNGKASPGQLRLILRNDDNRFSFFNSSSPLNQGSNSLKAGRKIRVRTTGTANPDPALLAKDRFIGSGVLDSTSRDETGKAWSRDSGGFRRRTRDGYTLAQTFAVQSATPNIATVDVGQDDYYVQVRYLFNDGTVDNNRSGLVYRFQDTSNYGALFVTGSVLRLISVVAGTPSTTLSVPIEPRRDVTIGLLVNGTAATVYLEGVVVGSGTAHNDTDTKVGIYSIWQLQRQPEIDEFYVWAGVPAETEGILWTGDVAEVSPSSPVSLDKTVNVLGEGWLSKLAEQDIKPPASVGELTSQGLTGVSSGLMVGAVLSTANLLHPPGPIADGTFLLGAVGLDDDRALDILRQFEEAELGFLYETNEGEIGFEDRASRIGLSVSSTWSDQAGGQFGYQSLDLLDWRREITNRVFAELSPQSPELLGGVVSQNATAAGVANDIDVILPSNGTVPGVSAGDLCLVIIMPKYVSGDYDWRTPDGWTAYRTEAGDATARVRIFAKKLDAEDLGATIAFHDDTTPEGGSYVAFAEAITNWYGDVSAGVAVAKPYITPSTTSAQLGGNNPPVIFPSWGPAPSLFFVYRTGASAGSGGATVAAAADSSCPHGYSNMFSVFQNGVANTNDVALQEVIRHASVSVEDPSNFANGETIFGGFSTVEAVTIAIRGFAGDPPETRGGQIVQVDDFDSQDEYNSIRTHTNPATLFADTDDATQYAETVLSIYGNDRPIFSLTFVATTNAAYRAQAIRRRISDKIRLVANGDTGMGVEGDFFIESISHRIINGGKHWEVTWQLSPA